MASTSKDLENIKSKVIEHLKSSYKPEQAEEYISKINSMKEDQFVEFLKQQGILKEDGNPASQTQCVFCSIVFGDIPSTKIGENEKAIAILEINPCSLGHSLVVPKEHLESRDKMEKEITELTSEIQKKIQETFKPKRVDLVSSNVMGHEIINVIPIYDKENIDSERKKLSPEDLEKIKEKIGSNTPKEEDVNKEVEKDVKKDGKEVISSKEMWLPKRLP